MKISENVYMHITYTFIWSNPHRPPNSLDPEAVTSVRRGWWPPCPCRPLPLRSWPKGRPGCYEAVYWPLSQLRSTWNNQGLQSFELGGQISWDQWSFSLQPVLGDFGCVWGGKATKSTVFVRPKAFFCVNFGQEWHLTPQYPCFGTKLSLKGKPRNGALLETFQSPVDLFSARKAFWTAAGVLYFAYIFL